MLLGYTVISLVLLLTWQASAKVVGVTDTEIKLGAHSYLTGHWSAYGVYSLAQRAYFQKINDQGGIHGRKINFLIEDSAGNPQQALLATRKLVEKEKIFAMSGSVGVVHMPSSRYLRQKKIPDIWLCDASTSLTEPLSKTTFVHHPSYSGEAKFLGEFIKKKWPGKKVGILVGDYADMKAEGKAVLDILKGSNEVVVEVAPLTAPNANAQVLNLKKAGVEVVYLQNYYHLAITFVKFAAEQNFKPQYVTSFLSSNNVFLDRLGALAEGTYGWHWVYHETDTQIPGVLEHIELLKKYLPNEKPSVQTLIGQAQAEIVVETLRRAGRDLTHASLIRAAESFDKWQCSVCRTPNSTSPTKHRFITEYSLIQVQKGKWKGVDSKSL